MIQPDSVATRWKNQHFETLFAILCVATIAGFFFSRALVSIGSVALVVAQLLQFGLKAMWLQFKRSWFHIICVLLLVVAALSFFWSADKGAWEKDTVTKLSFLVLPLGMSISRLDKNKFFKIVLYSINTLILVTVINSLRIYFANPDHAESQYMLTTTLYGDHIRFSFMIALSMLVNFYALFEKKKLLSKLEWAFVLISILLPFVYLHLLSARTGLLSAYVCLSICLLVKAWQYKRILAIGVLIGLACIPLLAIQLSPRLYNKVHYMISEATTIKDEDPGVQYNYSDNNRILSYNVASVIIKEHPILGVGTGDLRNTMKETYGKVYPDVPPKGRLEVPHMQLLSTAVGIGVPFAIICVLGLLISPLLHAYRSKFYIGTNMLLMLIYFMVDANLELQFGILIFLFFTLFWMIMERSNIQDVWEPQ